MFESHIIRVFYFLEKHTYLTKAYSILAHPCRRTVIFTDFLAVA